MIAETAHSHESDDPRKQDADGRLDPKAAEVVDLFQRVLDETIGKNDDRVMVGLRQRMATVARAHQGKSLDLDPIAIELTKAASIPVWSDS